MSTPDPRPGPTPPRGPDLGAVLGGLVPVAVGAAVAVHVLFGLSWNWKVWVAGILLTAGVGVVLASAAAALRRPRYERATGPRPR